MFGSRSQWRYVGPGPGGPSINPRACWSFVYWNGTDASAGKSTLLRILAGKRLTKTRSCKIKGKDVFMNSPGVGRCSAYNEMANH